MFDDRTFENARLMREASDLATMLTPRQEDALKASGVRMPLRPEQHRGQEHAEKFYFFWCPKCEHFAKNRASGYWHNRGISCPGCNAHYDFLPWWAPIAMLFGLVPLTWHLRGLVWDVQCRRIIRLLGRKRATPPASAT